MGVPTPPTQVEAILDTHLDIPLGAIPLAAIHLDIHRAAIPREAILADTQDIHLGATLLDTHLEAIPLATHLEAIHLEDIHQEGIHQEGIHQEGTPLVDIVTILMAAFLVMTTASFRSNWNTISLSIFNKL